MLHRKIITLLQFYVLISICLPALRKPFSIVSKNTMQGEFILPFKIKNSIPYYFTDLIKDANHNHNNLPALIIIMPINLIISLTKIWTAPLTFIFSAYYTYIIFIFIRDDTLYHPIKLKNICYEFDTNPK